MSIIFGSKLDTSGATQFGDSKTNAGIPGFPNLTDGTGGVTPDVIKVQEQANYLVEKLMNKFSKTQETHYVGSGKQPYVGSVEGKLPLLDSPSERQLYSQTPILSVVIKKRVFSSLKHLYNPIYMDEAEKLLFRATKKLIQRKCFIMAQYERLTKVANMMDLGYSPQVILANLLVSDVVDFLSDGQESDETDTKNALRRLEQVLRAQAPQKETTYFVDPFDPENKDFGVGSGVFEITTISSINTNLSLSGDGSSSFQIEDPYRILFINDEDIEISIQSAAKENYSSSMNSAMDALNVAQQHDSILSELRTKSKQKSISFSIYFTDNIDFSKTYNVIGNCGDTRITPYDLDTLAEEDLLSPEQKDEFNKVYNSLQTYCSEMTKVKAGVHNDGDKNLEYARKRMRLFYLGKCLIQPMDVVNVFINSGTRKIDKNYLKDSTGNPLSSYDIVNQTFSNGTNDELLLQEYNLYIKNKNTKLTFETFKKIKLLQMGNDSGKHVFGGIVRDVSDSFVANEGKYLVNVNVDSNMKWLQISRYNSQPSLDQSQSFVMDPLTPFDIESDPSSGLPTKWDLSSENQSMLFSKCPKSFFITGPKAGQQVSSTDGKKGLMVDERTINEGLVEIYEHIPKLKYKWKEGIMTMKYNYFVNNPKNNSLMDSKQLVRDIGFFWSNTPFDNMDAANIISIMVTGFPYNPATFVQCSKASFIADYSLNTSRDFFHTFFDVHRSLVKVNGDFIPFKTINVSQEDLALSTNLQIQLTGKSSQLIQMRTKYAELADKISALGTSNIENAALISSLQIQMNQTQQSIKSLTDEMDNQISLAKNNGKSDTVIQLAGDDISFDLAQSNDLKNFNEQLQYLTLRKKEDVVFNLDKNYLIVSDEYDKDYDIQAIVLQMRQQAPELFKNTWLSVDDLCKQVAGIMDFEFFADTQGHLVFRPPQYNKMPKTVFLEMMKIYQEEGKKFFPNSLLKLYVNRADSLIRDIISIEWKIVMEGALLGYTVTEIGGNSYVCDIANEFSVSFMIENGSFFEQTPNTGGAVEFVIKSSDVMGMNSSEKEALMKVVESSNYATQINNSSGLFSAKAQSNLFEEKRNIKTSLGNKETYDLARRQVSKFSGIPVGQYSEYEAAKVGAVANGTSSVATDISKTISNISSLISNRARLLKTLGKIIEQKDQFSISQKDILNSNDLNKRLLIDDTQDYLGYMSGARFIIKDENIISYEFSETPPELTSVLVKGGEPIIGIMQEGDAIGTNYMAFGCDFDMWRQYGWRSDRPFEKPYFTNAELQCAPYAVMLLSRQRKNITTGTVNVIGNEYYQLGDVVYLNERRLLYYVTGISHSLNYGGQFTTKLTLNYGHPPGEYIPTPLDIMGKMVTLGGRIQNAYRMNRTLPNTNRLLGIVQFNKDGSDDLFAGNFGMKNYRELVKSATAAKSELVNGDNTSAKIVLMSYNKTSDEQLSRKQNITKWFSTPTQPSEVINGIGKDGHGNGATPLVTGSSDPKEYIINSNSFLQGHLSICGDNDLLPTELKTISTFRIYASDEALQLDPTLEDIIEIRLVYTPENGWSSYTDTSIEKINVTP